ncbi:hypothetical protein [Alkalihalobacterium chitinilyticum]|uniref:YgdI/YgdR family lipoprotein n=1 Tax=Alkalihalobacterium chitinilyticum TaxID=2980103 RepID=A0ABT5VHP4_9BACI|nr:hypothetical protein [Alkalihalobacterium chitinilyticum]MDE5413983.1 YgdI/YgdR family lipoprotein [Alkalihalobacterium chitinilyticum]
MSKLSFILLAGLLVVSLVACGSTETNEPETDESTGKVEEIADNGSEHQIGETVENEYGSFTLIARNDEIDTQETGPMVLNIPQVNVFSGKLAEHIVELMEMDMELGMKMETDVINYIQIDMEVENTSEDTVWFYPAQAEIETNTGEELESDLWMSNTINGEFIGPVKKSGSQFFILEDSNAEDIEWVRIFMFAPLVYDDSYVEGSSVGDYIDFKVDMNK